MSENITAKLAEAVESAKLSELAKPIELVSDLIVNEGLQTEDAVELEGYNLKLVTNCQTCGVEFNSPVIVNAQKDTNVSVVCPDCASVASE